MKLVDYRKHSGILPRLNAYVSPTQRIDQAMEDSVSIKSGGTVASAGAKRKRATEPKFYAVRVGFAPGIYHTWEECLKQVTGYKKAKCVSTFLENCCAEHR